MGLLVTLHLISSNVYSSLDIPKRRGFSYIEIWMVGAQGVILIALFEYGIILAWKKWKKYFSNSSDVTPIPKTPILPQKKFWNLSDLSTEEKIAMLDVATFLFTFLFFTCFIILYWAVLYFSHFYNLEYPEGYAAAG